MQTKHFRIFRYEAAKAKLKREDEEINGLLKKRDEAYDELYTICAKPFANTVAANNQRAGQNGFFSNLFGGGSSAKSWWESFNDFPDLFVNLTVRNRRYSKFYIYRCKRCGDGMPPPERPIFRYVESSTQTVSFVPLSPPSYFLGTLSFLLKRRVCHFRYSDYLSFDDIFS